MLGEVGLFVPDGFGQGGERVLLVSGQVLICECVIRVLEERLLTELAPSRLSRAASVPSWSSLVTSCRVFSGSPVLKHAIA
jgi:hypothetical protein